MGSHVDVDSYLWAKRIIRLWSYKMPEGMLPLLCQATVLS
jgi:hypothetical protein